MDIVEACKKRPLLIFALPLMSSSKPSSVTAVMLLDGPPACAVPPVIVGTGGGAMEDAAARPAADHSARVFGGGAAGMTSYLSRETPTRSSRGVGGGDGGAALWLNSNFSPIAVLAPYGLDLGTRGGDVGFAVCNVVGGRVGGDLSGIGPNVGRTITSSGKLPSGASCAEGTESPLP